MERQHSTNWPPRLRPDQACAYLGVSMAQLKRIRARRQIRYYKITSHSVSYDRASCLKYLESRCVNALGEVWTDKIE